MVPADRVIRLPWSQLPPPAWVTAGFGTISTKAREVTELVSGIAHAAWEHETGLHHTNQALTLFDQNTQSNAVSTEEAVAQA